MRRWLTTLTALALAILAESPSALADYQEAPTLEPGSQPATYRR